MSSQACEVAIIGAGPYGLSAAAHLRAAGVAARIFGRAMEFWQTMPEGMLLRSSWAASHIADPQGALTLDRYQRERGGEIGVPVPLDAFIAYGQWFGRQVAPDLDERRLTRIAQEARGFRLSLSDGEELQARRVVVATGISPFAWTPPEFASLPAELAGHSGALRRPADFAGRRVAVIGGGSALKSAALLREAGAEVELIVREPRVHWLRGSWLREHLGPLQPLVYPSTDVGPPGLNWIVALPWLFRSLPVAIQEPAARRAIRPAGAGWLLPRLADVSIRTGLSVGAATPMGGQLQLRLSDGSVRQVDYAVLGTGYRVDIRKQAFLDPELLRRVRVQAGYPLLAPGFESTLPGLHFLGAPAALSFGPLMRFVSGTHYAGAMLARGIGQTLRAGGRPPTPKMIAQELG